MKTELEDKILSLVEKSVEEHGAFYIYENDPENVFGKEELEKLLQTCSEKEPSKLIVGFLNSIERNESCDVIVEYVLENLYRNGYKGFSRLVEHDELQEYLPIYILEEFGED